MRNSLLFARFMLVFSAFSLFSTVNLFGQCGSERTPVKTLHDAGAAALTTLHVVPTTIADLTALPLHSKGDLLKLNAQRIPPTETTVYRLQAKIIGFKKEADQDFHIVIADGKRTMIAEIPAPECMPKEYASQMKALRDSFEAQLGHATSAFKRLPKPRPVTITGIGFFDFVHKQTGHAANGIELHPVLAIEFQNDTVSSPATCADVTCMADRLVITSAMTSSSDFRIAKCDELIGMPDGEIWTVAQYDRVFLRGSSCEQSGGTR